MKRFLRIPPTRILPLAAMPLAGLLIAAVPLAPARAATPVVNWQALRSAGLTGVGETIGITTDGISGLATAEADGLVPADTVVTDPSYIGGGSSNPLDYSHAVFSAIVVHMIAPGAKIVLCNALTCSSSSDYDGIVSADGVNVIANNQDAGSGFSDFGVDGPYDPTYPSIPFQNANPDVLFVMADDDSDGLGYFQGQWAPITVMVGGQTLTVENFGLAAGGTSAPSETLANLLSPPVPVFLDAADANTSDDPGFTLYVYDANGNFVAQSGSETGACTGQYPGTVCVSIPAGVALPVKIYAALTSGTVTGETWLKLFIGTGVGYTVTNNWGLSIITPGSVSPPLVDADPNSIVTSGADSATTIQASSGVGPELGFDTQTDTFQSLDYPTVTGDWCLTLPASFEGLSEFCGNSNSAPEIAAVSALLLQAGLTPAEIENAIQKNSNNPATPGSWDGTWGYGIMDPLAALEQYVTLPMPAIEQGSSLSVTPGESFTLAGLCNQPTSETVSSYSWNFGDGITATTESVTHSYTQAGTYSITFNCTDSQNLSAAVPAVMTVAVAARQGSGGSGSLGPGTLLFLLLEVIAMCQFRKERDHATGGSITAPGGDWASEPPMRYSSTPELHSRLHFQLEPANVDYELRGLQS